MCPTVWLGVNLDSAGFCHVPLDEDVLMNPIGIVLCLFGMYGGNSLHFVDLEVRENDKHIEVSLEPQTFLGEEAFASDDLELSAELQGALDAPIRHGVTVLQTLDEQRQEMVRLEKELNERLGVDNEHLVPKDREARYFIDYKFVLAAHTIKGRLIQERKTTVSLGLSPKHGYLSVIKDKRGGFQVPFKLLADSEKTWIRFFSKLMTPAETTLKKPKDHEYIVDLYYCVTDVAKKVGDLPDSMKSLRILRTLALSKRHEQLGTSFYYNEKGVRKEVKNGHLRLLKDVLYEYVALKGRLNRGEVGPNEIETLLERMPAQGPFLALMGRLGAAHGQREKVFRQFRRLEPLVMRHPRTASVYKELKAVRIGERRKLMARKKHFKRDGHVKLEILSPEKNDYVGGDVAVTFALSGTTAPMLQADLYVNGKLMDTITEKPLLLHFQPKGDRLALNLEVITYFKNHTFQKARLPVRYVYIGQEEKVHRVSLRTVATQGGDRFLTDLKEEQVRIYEAKEARSLVKFRRDSAPLRIALLMDTSGSMSGEKLYRAQYAVHAFLKQLEAGDTVSVYSFDHKVMRFNHPSSETDALDPVLFTMRPQLTTSLHDAILVAHDDLLNQEGTRVIIVLSDGNDSTSRTDADSLRRVLKYSNALVYSIILGDDSGLDLKGENFLSELSAMTGSITTKVKDLNRLESSFANIYQELKSFYFVDFYSSQPDFDLDRVELKLKGRRGTMRYRHHRDIEQILMAQRRGAFASQSNPGGGD